MPTSRGTAACEAVVLSWLTHSIWPAPLETERATAHKETHTHPSKLQPSHSEKETTDILGSNNTEVFP